jgi:hypothetical protein
MWQEFHNIQTTALFLLPNLFWQLGNVVADFTSCKASFQAAERSANRHCYPWFPTFGGAGASQ